MKRVRYVGIVFASGSLERPSFRLVWNLANRYLEMLALISHNDSDMLTLQWRGQ